MIHVHLIPYINRKREFFERRIRQRFQCSVRVIRSLRRLPNFLGYAIIETDKQLRNESQ